MAVFLALKKIIKLILIWNLIFFSAQSLVMAAERNSDDEILTSTTLFSIGFIGWTDHLSEGEVAYRKIATSGAATARFWAIYKSDKSTIEAKLYTACALRKLSNNLFELLKKDIESSKRTAFTMSGDVRRKEPVSEVMERINRFGCE